MMVGHRIGKFRQHFAAARDPQFSLARRDIGSGPLLRVVTILLFMQKNLSYQQHVEILKEISVRVK